MLKIRKKTEELYRIVEEFIKENEKRIENKFKSEKVIIKHELKNELATKEDIKVLEEEINAVGERLRGEMRTMEERLMRYFDNKFNKLG